MAIQLQPLFLLVVRVAVGFLAEGEEFAELSQGKVALHVLLLVHHAAAQRFLMGLSLQDLLLDGPRLPENKHPSSAEGPGLPHLPP